MSAISGVGSANGQQMTELLEAQSAQMAELLQTLSLGGMDFAEKLVRLNAEAQVNAARQQTVGQVLNLYI